MPAIIRRQTFTARRLPCPSATEYKLQRRTVTYFEQQNLLPEFKQVWVEYAALHSQSLQSTVKRVDFAYHRFFQGLSGKPKFKPIRRYSGWTYPAQSGSKSPSLPMTWVRKPP